MPADLFDLTGKVAIITGASRGIGLASACRMAEHVADPAELDRRVRARAELTDRFLTLAGN